MTVTERLGRYRVGQRIGEGGTAEVYLGVVEGADGFTKKVAIKRLRASLAREAELREALLAEARVAQRLEHGNIVQVLDVGMDGEQPYLVVEYVEGVSLAELLADLRRLGRPMAVADAVYVTEQLLAALEYAHGLGDGGVIHRDVKPGNVLVSREGVIKLGDFGLARPVHAVSSTLPGMVKGTLGYLSPEQARGAPLDARADQFAAGVVLYEMCAGHNPLEATASLTEYVELLGSGLPELACDDRVDEGLRAIVARAVAVDRAARWPSVAELRHALESWRVERGVRVSAGGVRQAVQAILGEASTGRTLSLDDALGAELDVRPDAATRATPAAARADAGARWMPLVALAGAAAVVVAAWMWTRPGGGSGTQAVGIVEIDGATTISETVVGDGLTDASEVSVTGLTDASEASVTGLTDASEASVTGVRSTRTPKRPPAAATGRLTVNTLPWANVTVDGRSLGRTPVDAPLASGRHVLVLENPDLGRRAEHVIEVPAGDTVVIKSWNP